MPLLLLRSPAEVSAGRSAACVYSDWSDGPIISPASHPSIGANIQGPSAIKVPELDHRAARRLLPLFRRPQGKLHPARPTRTVPPAMDRLPPGSLQLEQSGFSDRAAGSLARTACLFRGSAIGSEARQSHTICCPRSRRRTSLRPTSTSIRRAADRHVFPRARDVGTQVTRVATSPDGIDYAAQPEVLGRSYMRVFQHDGMTYALAMPGQFYRSKDGFHGFEPGPILFNPLMRHAAVLKRGARIMGVLDAGRRGAGAHSAQPDRSAGRLARAGRKPEPVEVLRPEHPWEGADAPLVPSIRSTAYGHVNQLRDPAILEDEGRDIFVLRGRRRKRDRARRNVLRRALAHSARSPLPSGR